MVKRNISVKAILEKAKYKAEDWQIKQNIRSSDRMMRQDKREQLQIKRAIIRDKPKQLKVTKEIESGKYTARTHPYYNPSRIKTAFGIIIANPPRKVLKHQIKEKLRIPISTTRAKQYIAKHPTKKPAIVYRVPKKTPTKYQQAVTKYKTTHPTKSVPKITRYQKALRKYKATHPLKKKIKARKKK